LIEHRHQHQGDDEPDGYVLDEIIQNIVLRRRVQALPGLRLRGDKVARNISGFCDYSAIHGLLARK
jgi:hypothetical protein